jgi:hypothetical protein
MDAALELVETNELERAAYEAWNATREFWVQMKQCGLDEEESLREPTIPPSEELAARLYRLAHELDESASGVLHFSKGIRNYARRAFELSQGHGA